jgi:hypothetical protein
MLKNNAVVDSQGVFYRGKATYIHVWPKGNGNQNGLVVNGQSYWLSNGSVHDLYGTFDNVVIFNDLVKNSKAMGQWWIGNISTQTGSYNVNGATYFSSGQGSVPTTQLVQLHTETGLATTVMQLSKAYTGLATLDGSTFYTVNGTSLYKISVSNKSESLLGNIGSGYSFTDLSFAGTTLYGFDVNSNKLIPISTSNGAPLGSGSSLGMSDSLGSFIFMPTSNVPAKAKVEYD